MIHLTDACLDGLLRDLKSGETQEQVRKTLIEGLEKFRASDYDTEEREFIVDEFHEIASILGLDISDDLNRWLYGKVLGALLGQKKQTEEIIDVRAVNCSQCKSTLILKMVGKKPGVSSYWIIGRCVQCSEYNLLSSGEDFGTLKIENFTMVESFKMKDKSEEQAKNRLEQIKHLKGRN